MTVENDLENFFNNNPAAKFSLYKNSNGDEVQRIVNPWADETIALILPQEPQKLIDILNGLILPERLTAIYHIATKQLEIIWTAYKLSDDLEEIRGRTFKFTLGKKAVKCYFGAASDALLKVAGVFVPKAPPNSTNFRNLPSLKFHSAQKGKHDQKINLGEPISFWIEKIDYNEDDVINLIRNLNFHLVYHDTKSPTMNIHDPANSVHIEAKRIRYLFDEFPKNISCNILDDNLLSYWEGAHKADELMRFLFYYRILEYAALQFGEEKLKAKFKRVIKRPNIHHNSDEAVSKILSIHNSSSGRADEITRFKNLLVEKIDPKLLWSEIKKNIDFFSVDHKLDGGYVLKKLVASEETFNTFEPNGIYSFADSIRKIRNALSHGKDIGSEGVIRPTTRNIKLIVPWIHLMFIAAGEILVMRDD